MTTSVRRQRTISRRAQPVSWLVSGPRPVHRQGAGQLLGVSTTTVGMSWRCGQTSLHSVSHGGVIAAHSPPPLTSYPGGGVPRYPLKVTCSVVLPRSHHVLTEAVFARVTKAVRTWNARRDIGIDPLAPQLIINRRVTHGATP